MYRAENLLGVEVLRGREFRVCDVRSTDDKHKVERTLVQARASPEKTTHLVPN